MTKSERDDIQYVRDALVKEREYRRKKVWSLFSWTTTLLIGIIAGVVALSAEEHFTLVCEHRWLLTVAVVVLSFYCAWWLKINLDLEAAADRCICAYDADLGIPPVTTAWPKWLGYIPTVVLLFLATLVTIFVVPEGSSYNWLVCLPWL
jgi:hypothetical protein